MEWRLNLYRKVRKYIEFNLKHEGYEYVNSFWEQYGNEIVNEFEEVVDEQSEAAKGEALRDAYLAISKDANIDSNDINISRALHHIKVLIAETEQEVEYETDPAWENHKRMESDSK